MLKNQSLSRVLSFQLSICISLRSHFAQYKYFVQYKYSNDVRESERINLSFLITFDRIYLSQELYVTLKHSIFSCKNNNEILRTNTNTSHISNPKCKMSNVIF